MRIRTQAPGKMVLMGEYSVLDGHPAVVAAVDVFAHCDADDALPFCVTGSTSKPVKQRARVRQALPLLFQVIVEVERLGWVVPAKHYAVDTAAFSRSGQKVGLGSSAAAAVVFTQAVIPDAVPETVFRIAKNAHHAFQGGGSGIDIAASTFGGLVEFVKDALPTPAPALPTALELVVVFTGFSVSTQPFVDRYKRLPQRHVHAKAIADAASLFTAGCRSDDAAQVIAAVGDARRAMEHLGQQARADIVSDAHDVIASLARLHGGEAKPSGAGGGDIAVAFVPRDNKAGFIASVERAGFAVVPVGIAREGVTSTPLGP